MKMMISEQNIGLWAERFLSNELSNDEEKWLKETLDTQPQLKNTWEETLTLLRLMETRAERDGIKERIASLKPGVRPEKNIRPKQISYLGFLKHYSVKIGVAAALILASSVSTFFVMNNKNEKNGAQYMLLRREIETIKNSQSKIMDSIKIKSEVEQDMPLFGGTGFAITNDGYVATNYHVVKDANSIYIQTLTGENLKAYLIAFEPISDVAILKTEDLTFKFGKAALPYTLSNSISGLGEKVFTIGFPQEELVYNEGYISCEKGYEGDSTSYQLEMTANPGQSGAPVLDRNGNIIALITGKQSNTAGKTYAIQASALLQLISTLPEDINLRLTSNNKLKGKDRPQQVNQLRDFVCAIKVN